MASTLVQFRADENEKLMAIQILDKLGMSLPSYLKMCLSRLNQEKGIPFRMKLDDEDRNSGIRALKQASMIAEMYGISDMTLEEINDEINESRSHRS